MGSGYGKYNRRRFKLSDKGHDTIEYGNRRTVTGGALRRWRSLQATLRFCCCKLWNFTIFNGLISIFSRINIFFFIFPSMYNEQLLILNSNPQEEDMDLFKHLGTGNRIATVLFYVSLILNPFLSKFIYLQ